jgi:hypothetical protein
MSTKVSRLPEGSVIRVTICEFDDRTAVIENSSFHLVLKDELLNHSARANRVAIFTIPDLLLEEKVYLARIWVADGDVTLSSLDQILPSYVSVATASPEDAATLNAESAARSADVIKRNF